MAFDIKDDTLLTIDEICTRLSISRRTFERLRAPRVLGVMASRSTGVITTALRASITTEDRDLASAPQFPAPTCTIGGRNQRWSAKAVNAWIATAGRVGR